MGQEEVDTRVERGCIERTIGEREVVVYYHITVHLENGGLYVGLLRVNVKLSNISHHVNIQLSSTFMVS